MKWLQRIVIGGVLAWCAWQPVAALAALPINTWQTESGAKVMFMRTESLPMLDVRLAFPAGSRAEPATRAGLAGVVADLIGRGTADLTEQAIQDGFADTGAQFGSGVNSDYATVRLRTMTSEPELSQSLDLFANVVQNPEFREVVFERQVKNALSGLLESLTKPNVIASREFRKLLYPAHPYGVLVTEESLGTLSLEDVETFYQQHYLGNAAVVAIVGDVTRKQAETLANRLTANLPMDTPSDQDFGKGTAAKLQGQMQGVERVIPHPAAQSHVLVGLPAMQRGHPDYFNLLVANHVLGGGGFTSRLMKEIREDRGLAYSTYSHFSPLADAGPFQAGVQTKKEQTQKALKVMRRTISDFIAKGPTAQELTAAKSNLIDGFPLRIDSNSDLVSNLTMMGFYGLPLDFLDEWANGIRRVTRESAMKAFADHVDENKLVTVVVGVESLDD